MLEVQGIYKNKTYYIKHFIQVYIK